MSSCFDQCGPSSGKSGVPVPGFAMATVDISSCVETYARLHSPLSYQFTTSLLSLCQRSGRKPSRQHDDLPFTSLPSTHHIISK
eukprot:scaffold14736_cov260-Skeletonema_menzelii.AAC.2